MAGFGAPNDSGRPGSSGPDRRRGLRVVCSHTTLVIAMGECGRTPRINGTAGRDHWPHCYSVVLAGGGIRGGTVFGASDKLGAYLETDPITPADLAATLFCRFGLDPRKEMSDLTGRPYKLADGQPIERLFASRPLVSPLLWRSLLDDVGQPYQKGH